MGRAPNKNMMKPKTEAHKRNIGKSLKGKHPTKEAMESRIAAQNRPEVKEKRRLTWLKKFPPREKPDKCDYGCGGEPLYKIGKRWCCCKHHTQCPQARKDNKLRQPEIVKKRIATMKTRTYTYKHTYTNKPKKFRDNKNNISFNNFTGIKPIIEYINNNNDIISD